MKVWDLSHVIVLGHGVSHHNRFEKVFPYLPDLGDTVPRENPMGGQKVHAGGTRRFQHLEGKKKYFNRSPDFKKYFRSMFETQDLSKWHIYEISFLFYLSCKLQSFARINHVIYNDDSSAFDIP